MCAELQALEQEQRQIDGRAAEVETQLRSLMESGGVASESPHQHTLPGLPSPAALPDLGRSWEEARLGSLSHLQLDKGSSLLEAHGSGFWDACREASTVPTPQPPYSCHLG